MSPSEIKKTNEKKKVTSRQIVAIMGIILLVLLYVVTLIVAIVDSSDSGHWFAMCLFATIVVPILIWVYTWMYGKISQKHTFADFDPNSTGTEDTAGDGE